MNLCIKVHFSSETDANVKNVKVKKRNVERRNYDSKR